MHNNILQPAIMQCQSQYPAPCSSAETTCSYAWAPRVPRLVRLHAPHPNHGSP